jgi:CDP-glucose 4,6-dehydratase
LLRKPNSVRPWEHVLEPLSGYLFLGAKLNEDPKKYSEAWNFGPHAEDNKTVEELVVSALRVWGEGSYEVAIERDQPHEAGLLKLDINKASDVLGWRPRWNSNEAIKRTIQWYKDVREGAEGAEAVRRDIEAYSAGL